MKVLSLFDGISCGMVALERAGIPVERYVAYEIEENAIKVSKNNYPLIEQCGDVFSGNFFEYQGFDLLIGGSPCTYWSIAKASDGRETTSSGFGWELFMQYVRALQEAKPTYFLYENNESMSDAIKEEITKQLRVEPIMIDSADFSAQIRKRYYWTNIPIDMNFPKSDLVFKDILFEHDYKTRDFSKYADTVRWNNEKTVCSYDTSGKGFYSQANRSRVITVKANTLTSTGNDNNRIYVGGYKSRQLHPIEAERLQTLPDNYTSILSSETQRRIVCGNGWTVDVIAHIFTGLKEKEKKQMELRVNEVQLPEQILFNYEELKQELIEKVSMYETMVYTDEQIKEAKADKANLNKLKKALNDERIRREKEYMKPFNDFKTKINEIIGIIDKPVAVIDKQVKEFEEKQKQDKKKAIQDLWCSLEVIDGRLTLNMIFNQKWLNASVSMKSIQTEMEEQIQKFNDDMASLCNLPEFGFEAQQIYISTLDISKALNEAHRLSEMAKKKAEHEEAMRKIAEEQKQKEKEVIKNTNDGVYVQDDEKQGFTYKPQAEVEGFTKLQAEDQIPGQVEFTDTKSFDSIVADAMPLKQWVSFSALLSTEDALALKEFFNNRNIEFKAV